MQGFQDILPRGKRRVFTPIFPKNAKLFLLYETDKTAGKDVSFHWQDKAEQGHFLHRFNAASGVQKCTPSEPQNIQKYGKRAHSSVSTTFGLKLHLVLNASRKFVKFSLKPGNLHDVSCAEEVLAGCT
ncbi:MAG: hypothetical protein LBJ75_01285, partial [Puniceicoccales bacterium]|nr:hypothetical protein [Puniceicoccales bacterium]